MHVCVHIAWVARELKTLIDLQNNHCTASAKTQRKISACSSNCGFSFCQFECLPCFSWLLTNLEQSGLCRCGTFSDLKTKTRLKDHKNLCEINRLSKTYYRETGTHTHTHENLREQKTTTTLVQQFTMIFRWMMLIWCKVFVVLLLHIHTCPPPPMRENKRGCTAGEKRRCTVFLTILQLHCNGFPPVKLDNEQAILLQVLHNRAALLLFLYSVAYILKKTKHEMSSKSYISI